MRKLLFLLLWLSSFVWADGTQVTTFSSATSGTGINEIGSGISYHKLTWTVSGTVSTCTVVVDSSTDGISWNSGDVITAQACTTNGTFTSTSFVANFTRVRVATFVGTGTVTINYNLYVNNPTGGGGGAPTGAAGGDLGSTYPNPTVVGAHWTRCNSNAAITFAASPYTVTATDASCDCTAAAGAVAINLPASTGSEKEYFFIKTDSSGNACTVNRAGADTIEGATLVTLGSQYDSLLIRDTALGWMKVSPKTSGSNGQLFYNANGTPGGLTSSTADVCVSLADCPPGSSTLANSAVISLNRSWSVGDTAKSMHLFDGTDTYTGIAHENTLSGIYITQQFQGTGGCGHCINFVSRIQYTGKQTSGQTTDELDNYYADVITSSNPVDTVTLSTRYYALNGTIGGNGASTWANDAGFRNSFLTFSGTPTCTVCQGFVTDLPTLDNTQIGSAYGLRIGGATKSGKYVAMGIAGGESYFTEAIEQIANFSNVANTNLTTGGVLHSSIYSMFYQSNFCNQAVVCSNIDTLNTIANGSGAATAYGINAVADNGGNSAAALVVGGRFQGKNSGGATLTKSIAIAVVTPSNGATITDTSGVEIASLTAATQTNTPQAIKQIGANDINTFAGVIFWNGNKAFVTSDFTTAANTNLQNITGLTWTLPTNTAENVPFSCHLQYSQGTAAVAVSFGISASVAPTQINAEGTVYTSTTALVEGNLQGLNTTTATAIVTGTPTATATILNAELHGMIENPSGAASTITIMVKTATAADAVTIKRGSYCALGT